MSVEIIRSLYTPDEKAVLDEFFNLPSEQRDAEADYLDSLDRLGCGEHRLPGWYADTAAGVATIILQTAASRLPNWACVYGDGTVVTARFSDGPVYHNHAKLALLPRLLFEINWATSGPGFSWPMAYYLTWVPGYERFVVTGSSDSPEGNHGYCDLAFGYFAPPADEAGVLDAAAEIIADDWSAQYAEWDQGQWECLLAGGLIDPARARAMADSVWDPVADDELDDDWAEDTDEPDAATAADDQGNVPGKEAHS